MKFSLPILMALSLSPGLCYADEAELIQKLNEFTNTISRLNARIDNLEKLPQSAGAYIGEIKAFAFPYDSQNPLCQQLEATGWLYADGRGLSVTAYPDLAQTLGDKWGTSSPTIEFKIPDLRGRFLRGDFPQTERKSADEKTRASRFDEARKASAVGGQSTGTGSLQDSAFQAHRHGLMHGMPVNGGDNNGKSWAPLYLAPRSSYGQADPPEVMEGGLETRPENVAVSYWIYTKK